MTLPYAAPETPIITAGEQEEHAGQSNDVMALLPNLQKNYALDEKVIEQVKNHVIPVVQHCKTQRQSLEEEWRAVRRMLLLKHDNGQKYIGRSDAYIPVYSRALTNLVSQVSRAMFPSDEYMDVTEKEGTPPEAAKSTKQYLQYEFEKVAKLRANLKPFLREFFNFGVAVGKFWYEPKKLASRKRGKVKINPLNNLGEPEYTDDNSSEGFRFSTRSIFDWYIYPVTAPDIQSATLIAENIDVSRQFIEEMIRVGEWVNGDNALNAPIDSQHDLNSQHTIGDLTGSPDTAANNAVTNTPLGDQRTFTEAWCRLVLPDDAYVEGEEKGCPIMCKVVYAGMEVFSVRRNPFWHQDFPYVVARMEVLPGSFYPKGTGHNVRALQYLVNDFANQMNDNGTYALNPIVKVNPGVLAGPLPPLKPGVLWPMTDTDKGVVFDRPPIEQVQYGMQFVSLFMGMAQDFAGAPPAQQGLNTSKGSKTATGAQILQANARNPIQDLTEDLENEVLMPLMYYAWSLGQQYREGTIMDTLAGGPIKVSREQMAGNFQFRWLASSQAVNQQQRAQQAIQLLQIIEPLVPLLQMSGYQVNVVPLLQRIYSDGFGFRGFDQFISKLDPMLQAGMGSGGMVPGAVAPPQPGMSQGDVGNVRSALDQVYGGGQQMEAGEGEDFANVRDGADDMAALFGGLK